MSIRADFPLSLSQLNIQRGLICLDQLGLKNLPSQSSRLHTSMNMRRTKPLRLRPLTMSGNVTCETLALTNIKGMPYRPTLIV